MSKMSNKRLIDTFGIVLNRINFSDYDQILNILTPGLGKISAIAKGVRKKSNLQTEIMTFSKFSLFKGKTMYHINDINLIEPFYNIYSDYDNITKAMDIIKFTNQLIKEEADSEYKIVTLLLNALKNIDAGKNSNLINIVYKIKILQMVGYKLNLNNTSYIENIFDKKKKKVLLEDISIEIEEPIFKILEYIINSNETNVYNFKTTKNNISKLAEFLKEYLEYLF